MGRMFLYEPNSEDEGRYELGLRCPFTQIVLFVIIGLTLGLLIYLNNFLGFI